MKPSTPSALSALRSLHIVTSRRFGLLSAEPGLRSITHKSSVRLHGRSAFFARSEEHTSELLELENLTVYKHTGVFPDAHLYVNAVVRKIARRISFKELFHSILPFLVGIEVSKSLRNFLSIFLFLTPEPL